MIYDQDKLNHFSLIIHVAVASLSIVASRTISPAGIAAQCQLVVVLVGLVEVELVSAVVLDFACVLVDDGAVVHGVGQAPDWEGHHHKLHIKCHHFVHLHQEAQACTDIPSLRLQNP
jgi:hypothetical protein